MTKRTNPTKGGDKPMTKIRNTDYSRDMPELDFEYDEDFYSEDIPDPQQNPILPGADVPIQKVGVGPIDLPLLIDRRDGGTESVVATCSFYGSVDSEYTKGLNFSRFYRLAHKEIEKSMSFDAIRNILTRISETQECNDAFAKFRFKYRMDQDALRSRKELPDDAPDSEVFAVVEGKRMSHEKEQGHRFYPVTFEGKMVNGEVKLFMTVEYWYGATCPCSMHLAYFARTTRGKAANGHSQRAKAYVTVELTDKQLWIEDVVEKLREKIPTEVTVFMRRIDEMAQAEMSGSNLLFTEDACRLVYEGMDELFDEGFIKDFSIITTHEESIHPYDVTSVVYKGIENGLR